MQTGFDLDMLLGEVIRDLVRKGLLENDGRNVKLSRSGKYVADWIETRLF